MTTGGRESVGPYRLLEPIGRGGMGVVYRAYDPRLEREVAIKRIRAETASADVRARARLRREARAIARLRHPAVVQVFDIVEDDVEGLDWVVMELVEGETLAQRLERGALSVGETLELGARVAEGLAAAHRLGVIHRDLKSENLMITQEGASECSVKILDFGLAKAVDPGGDAAELSASDAILGTCRSMSPEQARSRPVDARSDLFSLGVLLYEALTAISPFRGDTPLDTLTRVVAHPQRPVRDVRPEVPCELSALIDRLLEKDPESRPSDAALVARELRRIAAGSSDGGAATLQDGANLLEHRGLEETTAAGSFGDLGSGRLAARKGRPWVLAALLLVMAAGVALGLWRWQARRPALLYVAVTEPIVERGAEQAGVELIADGVRSALLHDLMLRRGVSVIAPEEVDRLEGSPVEVGRALAVDEVLSSTLRCGPSSCELSLSRIATADAALEWSATFEAPSDELKLAADAAAAHLGEGFSHYPLRGRHQQVAPELFGEYLELRRQFLERSPDGDQALLQRLSSLRAKAPELLEVYLLEAKLARRIFYTTRDPETLERALDLAQRAHEIEPRAAEPLVSLFYSALDGNRLEVADEAWHGLERLEPGSVAVREMQANLLERRGDVDDALKLYRSLVRARPSVSSLYTLANMEAGAGAPDDARHTLERLLRRSPRHLPAQSALARLELLSGDPERAAALYAELSRRQPGYAFATNGGLAELLLGRYDTAAERFEIAMRMAPRNPSAVLNLADALELAGEGPRARELYHQVVGLTHPGTGGDDDWQTMTIRAQAYAHLGEPTPAVAAAQDGLRLAPKNPQAAYEVAVVYALVGDKASALVNIERALSLGMEERWFSFPWFRPLASEPRAQELLGGSGVLGSDSLGLAETTP